MRLRKLNLRTSRHSTMRLRPAIGGQMTDVGRSISTSAIGLIIQTVPPGHRASRRHRQLFQEELLIVHSGTGVLHPGDDRIPVGPGDAVSYLPGDPEPHTFENSGSEPLQRTIGGLRVQQPVSARGLHLS
jgi:uncharacterized cupin superfamily protein